MRKNKFSNDYRVLFERTDGVSIVIPTGEDDMETTIAKARYNSPEDPINITVVSEKEFKMLMPRDRVFRAAWMLDSKLIVEDPIKCQDVIRKHRDMALEFLDGEYIRESRKPDGDVVTINATAQTLRDMPGRKEFKKSTGRNDLINMMKEIDAVLPETLRKVKDDD